MANSPYDRARAVSLSRIRAPPPSIAPPSRGSRQAKGASPQARRWGAKAKASNVCGALRPANKPPSRCTTHRPPLRGSTQQPSRKGTAAAVGDAKPRGLTVANPCTLLTPMVDDYMLSQRWKLAQCVCPLRCDHHSIRDNRNTTMTHTLCRLARAVCLRVRSQMVDSSAVFPTPPPPPPPPNLSD